MNNAEIEQLENLFSLALDLTPEERVEFLERRLADEPWMKTRIDRLLRAHRDAKGFLHVPADELPRIPDSFSDENVEGRKLGCYTIRRVIATGGMSVVYEATQEQPRRTVALKLMRSGLYTERAAQRFRHEVEILGRLQHPNIARIYDAGIFDQTTWLGGTVPYFVMELIDGRPITEYAEVQRLNLRQQLALMGKVCRAVHYAHQKGVIHRDLKPSNILVDESEEPRILDFGVALATKSDVQLTTVKTDAREIIGTLPYMSPEQMLADAEKLDTRSDVYSLGVIMYQLLTGRLPFDLQKKSVPEVIHIVWGQDPVPLDTIDNRLRGDVKTIVSKALEKERTRRYQSASDLAADIQRHLAGEPVLAHPPSAIYQTIKLVRRYRWPFALIGSVLVLVIAFGIIAGALAFRLADEREAALQARDNESLARRAEAEQRRLADQRFSDVRHLATTLVFDAHDALGSLQGSAKARNIILSIGLRYLDALAAEVGHDDPMLLGDLAIAYRRIAFIQGDPYTTNLGRTEASIESCRKALALAEELLSTAPDDVRMILIASDVEQLLGALLESTGHTSKAVEYYESAIHRRERAARLGTDPLWSPRVDRLHSRFALTCISTGRLTKALEHSQQAATLLEKLVESNPEDRCLRADLAQARVYLGTSRFFLDEIEKVFDPTLKAIKVLESFVVEQPLNSVYHRDLATGYLTLGRAWAKKEEPARAIPLLKKSLDKFRALYEIDPDNINALRNLFVNLQVIGDVWRRINKPRKAYEYFEEMLDSARKLHAKAPESLIYRRDLATSHNLIGIALYDLDRFEESFVQYQEAQKLFEELAADSRNPIARRDLAVSYYFLAQIHKDQARRSNGDYKTERSHWNAAATWYRKAGSIFRSLREDRLGLPQDDAVIMEIEAELTACKHALAEPPNGSAPD